MELTEKPATKRANSTVVAVPTRSEKVDELTVYAVAMIRNDADLIKAILSQAKELFDHFIIADVQSTDGTSEIVQDYAKTWPHITHLKFRYEEKHQGAMMNALVKRAVDEGADWVFLIDGDEFLSVKDRGDFQTRLKAFPFDVMHLPWINLVPTTYGDFKHFDVKQDYRWSGRVHELHKIALSSAYVQRHPSFNIHEGNHNVSRTINMHDVDWQVNFGIPLLHLPVRSAERLRYKIKKALATLLSKHNRRPGEGFHVIRLAEILSSAQPNPLGLNAIAASYSMQQERQGELDVEKLKWPIKRLPDYIDNTQPGMSQLRSSWATSRADVELSWKASKFPTNSILRAFVDGGEIKLAAQPIAGGEVLVRKPYAALRDLAKRGAADLPSIAEAVAASLSTGKFTPGAHSAAIGAFCALVRPRRFVDLAISASNMFLEMCVLARAFNPTMECIAVGSWDGSRSHEGEDEFQSLTGQIRTHFPRQQIIRAYSVDAVASFEDGSVDMLRLPVDCRYEGLTRELARWTPKLSADAVILVPQINVHTGETEAWRLWDEIEDRHVCFEIPHDGGLGVYAPGKPDSAPPLLTIVGGSKGYAMLARRYIGAVAEAQRAAGSPGAQESLTRMVHERDAHIRQLDETMRHLQDRRAQAEQFVLTVWQEAMAAKCEALIQSEEKLQEAVEAIKATGMFDVEHYITMWPDVKAEGLDPLVHYVIYGMAEMRSPNNWFDPKSYLLANYDVMAAKLDPFLHFLSHGRAEGRPLL